MSSLISPAPLGLWDVRLPLQCWSVAPQPLFRMLLRTHLSPGLFQGNESSVQMWQSPSKQEGKCSPVFQILLSSLQYCRLIEAFSKGNFCCSQPSFPCLIRNRSVFLGLDSLNSPWGEMWNKRINYFKTEILSSLGIKLESENEKHRRCLAVLRCFTGPPDSSPLFRFQFCLTLVSMISSDSLKNVLGEIEHWWGNKTPVLNFYIAIYYKNHHNRAFMNFGPFVLRLTHSHYFDTSLINMHIEYHS